MKIKTSNIIIILSIFCTLSAKAQIKGKVFEQKSKVPIALATINIEGTTISVLSNEQGLFKIFIPENYRNKKLIISCLGYKNDTLIAPYKLNKVYNIALAKQLIQLPEVVIKSHSAIDILKKAIDKIPDNYATKPVYLNAYYREMVATNGTFVKYVDAATKIYYSGYNLPYDFGNFYYFDYAKYKSNSPKAYPQGANKAPSKNDAVQILEVRKSNNLEQFNNRWDFEASLKKFDISGGPLQVTSADIVKHRKDMLNPDTWKYYKFKYEGTVTNNSKETYKITFQPKKKNKVALWQGTMYIDKESYAFIDFEYSIDDKCRDFLKQFNTEIIIELDNKRDKKQIKKSKIKRTIENTNQEVKISYSEYQGKWYVSHIRIKNIIENTGNLFEKKEYTTLLDLYVNGVQLQNVIPIDIDKVYKSSNFSFLYHYPSKYHPKFWEHYNTPIPTKIVKKALLDLEKEKSLQEQFRDN